MTRRRTRRTGPVLPRLLLELLEDRTLLSASGPQPVLDLSALRIDPDSYETGDILVRFRPESTGPISSKLDGTAIGEGFGLVPGLRRVQLAPGVSVAAALAAYQNAPDVLYAEPDYRVHVALTPNDLSYTNGTLWGLNNTGQNGGTADADIDAPEAWDLATGSGRVAVAVIDTGVDYTHPDLYLNIWINQGEVPASKSFTAGLTDTNANGIVDFYDLNSLDAQRNVVRDGLGNPVNAGFTTDSNGNGYRDGGDLRADPTWFDGFNQDNNSVDGITLVDDVFGYDFFNRDSDPIDDHDHGTHVSGTIGGIGNNGTGVVGVNWNVSILPLKFLSAAGSGSNADAIHALNYAVSMGVKISSNSYGGGGFDQSFYNAIAAAGTQGHLFVAAAGNGNIFGIGQNNDATPSFPASYNLPNIISVAATDRTDHLASFSNYGLTSVDLAAPGVSITSSTRNNTYSSFSGTSMATPHVAGAVALLWGSDPSLTSTEVKQRILGGTDSILALNPSKHTVTDGRLNAANSLRTDLSWNSLTAPSSVGPDQSFTVGRNYRVSGSATGPDFAIAYYLSTDTTLDAGDTLLGTEFVTVAGDKAVGAHAGTSPGLRIATAGTYFVLARVDDGGAVPEFSEANNIGASSAITVNGPPALSIRDVVVTEGNAGTTDAVFTVTLSSASTDTVTVDYATADNTAVAPADYVSIPLGRLVFTPGETSQTFTVVVNGDTEVEPDETFFVNLSNPTNAGLTDGQGVGTIRDDDQAVTLSVNDVTVTEGNAGTVNAVFTVTLSAPAGSTVTVSYATANGTATAGSDYTAVSGTLTFTPGQTSKLVAVAVLGDTIFEANETFFLNLSNPSNATLTDGQGQSTITDNDTIGAEAFGYRAYGHPFEALDLVPGAAGVTTLLTSGDDVAVQVNLAAGTSFNFYGTTYTSLFVSTNGLITFGSGNNAYTNTDLTSSPSQRALAPMWDDWLNTSGNAILLSRYDDLDANGTKDRLVLEWNKAQGYASSPSSVTFQVILQLSTGTTPGAIIFNYPDLNAGNFRSNGGSATVGIKDSGTQGSRRLLVSFNSGTNAYVQSGKAIRISTSTVPGMLGDADPAASPASDEAGVSVPATAGQASAAAAAPSGGEVHRPPAQPAGIVVQVWADLAPGFGESAPRRSPASATSPAPATAPAAAAAVGMSLPADAVDQLFTGLATAARRASAAALNGPSGWTTADVVWAELLPADGPSRGAG